MSETSPTIATSTGALRIGGNTIWPEWFSGLIDEVRIYNRALTQAQIQADMNTPLGVTDTQPPSAPANLNASGSLSSVSLSWSASTDNVGVARYDVYRSTTPGFTPAPGNRIAQPSGTSYTDSGLAAGTYYYKVQAEDAAGNLSASSNEASATVSTAPPVGLMAAYSFDQGSGTSLPDLSGNGNNGTIANASWSTAGKYGSALSFNGSNAIVNVPDSSSLDLTSGMTLEAWVNPSALGNSWRTVLMKEQSGNFVYDLYANGSGASKVPVGEVYVGGERTVAAPSALTANAPRCHAHPGGTTRTGSRPAAVRTAAAPAAGSA